MAALLTCHVCVWKSVPGVSPHKANTPFQFTCQRDDLEHCTGRKHRSNERKATEGERRDELRATAEDFRPACVRRGTVNEIAVLRQEMEAQKAEAKETERKLA